MSARVRWAGVLVAALAGRPVAAQRLTLAGTLSSIDHRVDAGFGLERAAGLVTGGVVRGRVALLDVEAHARTGRLRLQSPTGTDQDVAELGAGARWWLRSWVAARGELVVRGYSADVGRQRWTVVSLGPELRVPFAAGRVYGVARGAWLPVVSVSGLSHPKAAFTASAGTEYAVSHWAFALTYELERYDFRPQGVVARFEQVSALTLTASVGVGR